MSTPYPCIERWALAERVLTATLTGVRRAGLCGRESGAFWLGKRVETAMIWAVVIPSGTGVEERPDQWRVSPEVFGAVTRWAKPQGLTLLAIAHTHVRGVPPRLSWADRHYSVQVPGMLAVVIGNGGEDRDYRDWGWYVYENGDYRNLLVPELAARLKIQPDGKVEIWRADAHGVWELRA